MSKERTVDVIRAAAKEYAAQRIAAQPELAEAMMRWYAEEFWSWVHMAEPRFGYDVKRGRRDTRGLHYRFELRDPAGLEPSVFLCEQLAKHALDVDGQPIDWRGDAQTFLLQLGVGVPLNVSALTDDVPPAARDQRGADGA